MKTRVPELRALVFATLLLLAAATPQLLLAQAAANPARPAADDYRIGPGDSLKIFVARAPELSAEIAVRPDGKITTPLVENMVAVGKTPSQLARDMEAVLAEYVRTPQVSVILDNAVSTFSQVKVMGQVKQPQALPYREGLRVVDVILAVGGLTDFASPNKARIVREVDGKTVEIKVKLGNLVNKSDMSQNFELKPGDVFFIPQSLF